MHLLGSSPKKVRSAGDRTALAEGARRSGEAARATAKAHSTAPAPKKIRTRTRLRRDVDRYGAAEGEEVVTRKREGDIRLRALINRGRRARKGKLEGEIEGKHKLDLEGDDVEDDVKQRQSR